MVLSRVMGSRALAKQGVNLIQKRTKFESRWDDPHEPYTGTGSNLPFNMHCNRYVFLLKAFLFCGSAFWVPFMSYHYLRTKQMR